MHHHHSIKNNEMEAPHEPVVGAIIAITVVSIVMNALFTHMWFSIIIQIILFIHLVKCIIEYLQNAEARRNYQYHTEINEVIQIWVALIIVSIIMRVLFDGQWFAQIAPAVLRIKAIEITVLYLVTLTQRNHQKQLQSTTIYVQQPIYTSVQSVDTQTTEKIYKPTKFTTSNEENLIHYCPICGEKTDSSASFCPYCGTDLRR
ncbi:MAG: zinc ribbon domain-containing protein [Candidatus Lokiarchaeota archaeon]|nr:zinc ribbon domain-containing protein [Candidatus Harpocratesius repetitus]